MQAANTPAAEAEATSPTADRLGIAASTACAAHCAATALAPGILSALGLGALMGHEAEWGFTVLAIVLALLALWQGWRVHRSSSVAVAFAVGALGLVASRLVEELGVEGVGGMLGIAGGAALVVAHVMNIRASRRRTH